MLDYIEYLDIPATIAIVLVALFLALRLIMEILETKGKVVPEILNIKKRVLRKKQERATIAEMPKALAEVKDLLNSVNEHYSEDNITMRNQWMANINKKEKEYDRFISHAQEKIDRQSEYILSLLIENKRNIIIDFASRVTNKNFDVTREQFNQVFKVYEEYEEIIEENELTNGEVDIAFRIIMEAYEENTKNHTFLEDVRGYGV